MTTASFPGREHDHGHCIDQAMARAEALCGDRRARLTALRRRVLELVWASHAPIGAYDLLKRLRQERDNAEPPTVYRALDFLLQQGLIHRIESLNAFVGCAFAGQSHAGHFLICKDCGRVAEMHDPKINAAITHGAAGIGFAVQDKTLEVAGLCPGCQAAEG
jgi:Fur family zinc uptake transcriptional regulator